MKSVLLLAITLLAVSALPRKHHGKSAKAAETSETGSFNSQSGWPNPGHVEDFSVPEAFTENHASDQGSAHQGQNPTIAAGENEQAQTSSGKSHGRSHHKH